MSEHGKVNANLRIIKLPKGTNTVTVRDIPSLIANALHPDKKNRIVRLIKEPHGSKKIVDLTDKDWALLNTIWSNLPPYKDGLTELEWQPYLYACSEYPRKPNWKLMVSWKGEMDSYIAQSIISEEHGKALAKAIQQAEIKAYSAVTRLTGQDALGEAQKNLIVSVDDLRKYVSEFELAVHVQGETDWVIEERSQADKKRVEGRYTLEEAADQIAKGESESNKDILDNLMIAAFSHDLPTYAPGKKVRYDYSNCTSSKNIRVFYEEAYWDDLNKHIAEKMARLKFRFPAPCDELSSPEHVNSSNTNSNALDWKVKAKQIGVELRAEYKKLSIEQIAKKVHTEMVRRHSQGEPGMTKRGGIEVPMVGSIRRHALQGI